MIELRTVAAIITVFAIARFIMRIINCLRRPRLDEISESFKSQIEKIKIELSGLLGVSGVTDEAELDRAIANWLGSYEKSRHIAGLNASSIFYSVQNAQRRLRSRNINYGSVQTYLDQAYRQLGYLKTQLECLKPQQ